MIRIWDLASKQVRLPLEGHTRNVYSMGYSPDSQMLVSADVGGRIILWDLASRRKKVYEWQLPGTASRVAFAPDGRHFISVNGNGTVYVFRVSAVK